MAETRGRDESCRDVATGKPREASQLKNWSQMGVSAEAGDQRGEPGAGCLRGAAQTLPRETMPRDAGSSFLFFITNWITA